jgi:hypothetical protein
MKFTKSAFRNWLLKKSARTIVGKPVHVRQCPLCEFLRDQGSQNVSMLWDERTVDGRMFTNPKWAVDFQTRAIQYVSYNSNQKITAGQALRFL